MNEEERYLILKLEVVKEHLFEIYKKKMNDFEKERDQRDLIKLRDLQKFLFRILQIFGGLISKISIFVCFFCF